MIIQTCNSCKYYSLDGADVPFRCPSCGGKESQTRIVDEDNILERLYPDTYQRFKTEMSLRRAIREQLEYVIEELGQDPLAANVKAIADLFERTKMGI